MQLRLAGVLAALTLTSVSLAQSDLPAPGFAQTGTRSLPFAADPCGFAGSATLAVESTLSDGRIVQFTGLDVLMLASDGSRISTVATLPGAVFPGFLTIDPSESFAVIGESCNGDVLRVDLASGVVTPLANLAFNYDGVFASDPDYVFVSAAGNATFGRNRIYLVNVNTGHTTLRGRVAGYSGPLALAPDGSLFYATQAGGQPVDIIKWSPALTQSNALLREDNASVFRANVGSASGLTFDPSSGNLVVNAFQELRLFSPSGTDLGTLASADPTSSTFLGNVEVEHAGGTGSLQAFQPANAAVRYTATDFFSFGERRTSVPARAVATLTGPTSGPAAKTLTITGAHPNTRVLVYFNLTTYFNPAEFVFGSFAFPFHTALPLNRSRALRPPIIADAQGTAVFNYNDPGGLHGTLVFQALIRDAGGATVGTSTYALN